MSRAVVAVLALFILAIGGVYGLEAALESAGEDHIVTNESWTATQGTVATLDHSDIGGAYYGHNATVYNVSEGATTTVTEMDRGTDYEWFAGNGTVKPLTGGDLVGDALITYDYQRTTAEQRRFAALSSELPTVLGLIAPALLFVIFLAFLRG